MDLRENKALTPVESGMPIVACTIDLTLRCNLGCKYCFAHCFSEYDGVDLTLEQAKKTVDWLFKPEVHGPDNNEKVDIAFWGGEPLLRWELLKEIVLYAEGKSKETGIPVSFGGTTNVTLLTPDKFDFLDEHKIRFLLSIDGTKEHHDKHRVFKNGKGSWDTVDKNAVAILERWPDSQVRFSYSVENLDGFIDDLNYLYGKGFRDIVYSPVSEGDWTEERIAKLEQVWDEVADWYIEKKKESPNLKMKFIEDGCKVANGLYRGNTAACGAGRGYVGITVDGAIYPCHRFNKFDDKRPWYEREVCIGHIDYGILNQEFREKFVKWDPDTSMPESCKQCKTFKKGCNGGCWATNFDLNGDISKVPYMNCRAELATLKQGEKIIGIMGKSFADSLMAPGGHNIPTMIPQVQGCQCYNVHDAVYGRKILNTADRNSCLCNMSTYGVRPGPVTKCSCYNMENQSSRGVDGFFDQSGATCRRFTKVSDESIKQVMEMMRQRKAHIDNLTENERKQLEEYEALEASIAAGQEEFDALSKIRNTLEK